MNFIHRSIKWVMLASGLLTCTMFYAAVSPDSVMQSSFGESLDGPLAQIIVRSWGVLVGLVGLMLIHGAFNVATRRLALLVAGASKIAFMGLVLFYGRQLPSLNAGSLLVADSMMVLLFTVFLLATRSGAREPQT